MTERVCFELRVDPARIDEYVARHSPVRSEMLAELAAAGLRNYSLFLSDDGRVLGYYETDDVAAARTRLAASAVVARWEADMAPLFVGLQGRPDQDAPVLREVFHLEDQLAAASAPLPPTEGDAS